MMLEREKPPADATAEGLPRTDEANGNSLIANDGTAGNGDVAFASDGMMWRYSGKRGRVLAMPATTPSGVTQWDTLPWHTRLGGTIHVLRQDGLTITTEREGKFRHARYRLAMRGRLIKQAENREAAA